MKKSFLLYTSHLRKLKVSVIGTFASYFRIYESDLTQLLYQLLWYRTLLRINICLNYNSSFFNLQISEKSQNKKYSKIIG